MLFSPSIIVAVFFVLACQGVSCAGGQAGLKDRRTGLLTESFRIFDSLADPPESQY